ncbi:hypothetical protein [Nitrospirillum viridazoti]|uniref:hypothetical protein n=1 Tax=Nitrospirillum viridazoti TaxID=3144925 RepID=UPI00110FC24F|nr:hypothetical protein [Nitrospirillum amazonense]
MEESYSDQFYAALATVRFGEPTPMRGEFTEAQWALLAAWGRAGYGTGMHPPCDALPDDLLRLWAPHLLIFHRADAGWERRSVGSAALWLLGKGQTWASLPAAVRVLAELAAAAGRPSLQRLPNWLATGNDLSVLILPLGEKRADQLLIAAYSI